MFARFLHTIVLCFTAVFCIACDLLGPSHRSFDISQYFSTSTSARWEYQYRYSYNDGRRVGTLPQGYVWRSVDTKSYQLWSIKRIQNVNPDSTYCVLESIVKDTIDNYTETLGYMGWVSNSYTTLSSRTDTLVIGVSPKVLSISYEYFPWNHQIFDLSSGKDTLLSGNGVFIKKIGLTACFAGGSFQSGKLTLLSFRP